jgi:hypothetical protein
VHKYSLKNNYLQSPRRKLSFGDGVVEVADRKVRIVLGHVVGFLAIEVLNLLISLPVKLKQKQEKKLSYQFSSETNKKQANFHVKLKTE